jgi:hypothetical protein
LTIIQITLFVEQAMHDDPADLDGDGQFDLIDLVIMGEEQDGENKPPAQSGCLVMLLISGGTLAGLMWKISDWLV